MLMRAISMIQTVIMIMVKIITTLIISLTMSINMKDARTITEDLPGQKIKKSQLHTQSFTMLFWHVLAVSISKHKYHL